MASDKEYFDAKFDGLKDLLRQQDENMKGYVGAVSASVREVRSDLQTHKESADAHGAAASNRSGGTIVLWLSLAVSVVAAVAAFAPLLKH